MTFPQDRARMLRILQACDASPAIIAEFEDICRYRLRYRSKETAEELLRDVCIRHGFVEPYTRDRVHVVIRPCCLNQDHPDYRSDIFGADADPAAEQSYRRGYDQGANKVLQMLKDGKSISEIEERVRELHQWRTQPIQSQNSSPGNTMTQELPDRWKSI